MKVIKNKKYTFISVATFMLAGTLLYIFPPHFAETHAQVTCADGSTNGSGTDTCISSDATKAVSATANWDWSVNVQEVLTMSVTEPTNTTGNVGDFMHEETTVSVVSNNADGFTVGMTTNDSGTDLKNSTSLTDGVTGLANTIPTLESSEEVFCVSTEACPNFRSDKWGYALGDGFTYVYKGMVGNSGTPITVLTNKAGETATSFGKAEKKVHFGAKATAAKVSGLYQAGVVFTVTSGKPTPAADEPSVPQEEGPSVSTPGEAPSIDGSPTPGNTYAYSTGGQTYRSTAESMMESTSTNRKKRKSTAGDYVSPLGVNERGSTTMNVQHGSPITTVLMVVAFLAAGIGIFFFILAKKRDEEEEEES